MNEGDSLSLSANMSFDSDGDPLWYEWDLDADGIYDDFQSNVPTLPSEALYFPNDGPGLFEISVRVSDNRGLSSTSSTTVSVANSPPVAHFAGPSETLPDEQQFFILNATDSADDAVAGFEFSVDWGDGWPPEIILGSWNVVVPHYYPNVGAYFVTVTATDRDGGVSQPVVHPILVTNEFSEPNSPLIDLHWYGTPGADVVHFEQIDATTIRVITSMRDGVAVNDEFVITGITGMVNARGLAGDDTLDASGLVNTAARLDGGTGNNTLFGGAANDVLIGGGNVGAKVNGPEGQQGNNIIIGGAGDDTLYGNAINGAEGKGGNNILMGGDGNDTLYGNWYDGGEGGGRNILVGGAGSNGLYDYKVADGAEGKGSILIAGDTTLGISELSQVMNEWASPHTYADRVANILGPGAPTRLNDNSYLQPGSTVTSDAELDRLWGSTGGAAFNWFWYVLAVDEIYRAKVGETQSTL